MPDTRLLPPPRLAALAAAALLAGCSLMPKYERPAAPVAAHWPTTSGMRSAAGATAPATPAADVAWTDYFPDERLRRLVGIALAENRDLRSAVYAIEQAQAQYQIQRAAQYPQVGVSAAASRAPSAFNGKPTNSFQVGLALTAWEADFFGRIASLKEAALAQYLATEEGRNAAQTALVASVANAWIALLADEELLDLSRRTLQSREESIRLTRLRLEAGVSSALDFRQAESLTEQARATLAQQQRQRAVDENALVLLLGQPLPEDIRAALPALRLSDAPAMPELPAGLPSDLLERRPDIRQAEQQLISANANIGSARANFFPRISLTAGVGSASGELDRLFHGGTWVFSIAPQLLLPIFDAGRNRATLEVAEAQRASAVAAYEKSIQNAFREVADALAGRATLGEQWRAQQAQAQAESARLQLSDLRYRNGVSSYLDLLDAQRSLFAAQQLAVSVHAQQLQNQVVLYRVLGGGLIPAAPLPPDAAARAQARAAAR